MALRALVKISGVNNLSDARYTAGMGVELMGFDLEPDSVNYVDPDQFQAITSWLSGVKLVGEIESFDHEIITAITRDYMLDYLQIKAQPTGLPLVESPVPLIIKIDNNDQKFISEVMNEYATFPKWYLLEPEEPMPVMFLDWCKEKANEYPIILGGNITVANVDQLLDSGISGIALKGGQEIRPGYTNFDELADILEQLEVED